ncbi:MAG: hypothetical protein IJC48_00130 [Clostridia bacterium]|nr:hypothetical protein [Clostridia bacterium]
MENAIKERSPIKTSFRRIFKYAVGRFHAYGLWESLLFLSTIAFLIFWTITLALGKGVCGEGFFKKYLINASASIGISAAVCFIVIHLLGRGRIAKTIANILLSAILVGSAIVTLGSVIDTVELIGSPKEYFSDNYSENQLANSMIENRKFFGNRNELPGFYEEFIEETIERDREMMLLMVLSYEYGFWVILVLMIIAFVWLISAAGIYLRIRSRWFEWVFLINFLAALYWIGVPLLISIGILPAESYLYQFFYEQKIFDMTVMFTLPLFTLITVSKRNSDDL